MSLKYIAPGSWFSLEYPVGWHEFEDAEDTFLFYNPDKWSGNFRISAYRGEDDTFADCCMQDELQHIPGSRKVKVGRWNCVYSVESFQENGTWYATHVWITGSKDISVECSFTTLKGESVRVAESILSSLHIRQKEDKPLREIIPVRVLEINAINSGFDNAVSTIKKKLTKDFTSVYSDMESIQKVMEGGSLDKKQRQPWMDMGFAWGAILYNEIDGMEWVTVIDGSKEYPALRFRDTDVMACPGELIWNRVKQGKACDLKAEFAKIRSEVEKVI